MEPVYVLAGVVVVAVVVVVVLLRRRSSAAKAVERDDLAREIAEFNASRTAEPPKPAPAPQSQQAGPREPASSAPSDTDAAFRKPGMPKREVDPLNDRSKSLQDRWDGSGRKR